MKELFLRIFCGVIPPDKNLPVLTKPCGLRKVVGSDLYLVKTNKR